MAKTNITSDIIKLKNVRLSFPEIWRPKSFGVNDDGTPKEPKHQATFLLDPSNSEHAQHIKEIKRAAKKVLIEAFGEIPPGFKRCFGLADKHAKKRAYDGYKGMFYIATGNATRPTLVDRHRNELVQSDGVLYAGCYVHTNVTLWTFDHPKGGQGVAANLRIIQFFKDGEPFGNAPAKADEELDDVEVNDDGADDDWDKGGGDSDFDDDDLD